MPTEDRPTATTRRQADVRVIRAPQIRRPPVYTMTAIITLSLAVLLLKLWQANLTIPLYYAFGGDIFGQEAAIKNLADHGSLYANAQLAAPLGAVFYDFPSLSDTHLLIERVLVLVLANPFVALNVYFLVLFPLSAVTLLYALRRLGLPTVAALPPALLFAFLPTRFLRNESHLFYAAYWLVPLLTLTCIFVARGERLYERCGSRWFPTRDGWLAIATTLLIGSDNQYNAYFSVLFLLLAGIMGVLRSRTTRPMVTAIALSVAVAVSLVSNLVPSVAFHRVHGQNSVGFQRYPEESQIYGLQIAQLLLPVQDHRIPVLAAARSYFDSRLPLLSNENGWSSLGAAGSIGFLLLLAVVVLRLGFRTSEDLDSVAILNLAAILIATVGGFGTLFNYFVRPELRAYNRVSSFVACFSLIALGYGLSWIWHRFSSRRNARQFALLGVALIVGVGIYDQYPKSMRPPYSADALEFASDESFVHRIEGMLPSDGAIFELPSVRFPESAAVVDLDPFQLFRPYLHSKTLRWSYGAIDGRAPAEWDNQIATLPPADFMRALLNAGFSGIYLFRNGYADRGAAMETAFAGLLHTTPLVSPDGTSSFFSLRDAYERSKAKDPRVGTRSYSADVVTIIAPVYGEGFSVAEHDAAHTWRWSEGRSTLILRNERPQAREVHFRATVAVGARRDVVTVRNGTAETKVDASPSGEPLDLHFTVPPGETRLAFATEAPPLNVPGDRRTLVFRLIDPTFQTLAASSSAVDAVVNEYRAQSSPLGRGVGDTRIRYTGGCGQLEQLGTKSWRWCGKAGSLVIDSQKRHALHLRLSVATPGRPASTFTARLAGRIHRYAIAAERGAINIPIRLEPGHSTRLDFETNAPRLIAPGDPRELYVRFDDVRLTEDR